MFLWLLLLFTTPTLCASDEQAIKVGGHRLEVETNGTIAIIQDEGQTSINAEGIGTLIVHGKAKEILVKKKKEFPNKEEDSKCIIM